MPPIAKNFRPSVSPSALDRMNTDEQSVSFAGGQ